MRNISINGQSFEINIGNADWVEKYEAAMLRMEAARQEIASRDYQSGETAKGMREICSIVETFFDTLYGEGTSAAVFGKDNGDMFAHIDAVETVVDAAKADRKVLNDKLNQYNQKLGGNRYQRRNGNKR